MNKHVEPIGDHASTPAVLASENLQLRQQMQELLKQAHSNQRIMQRHHALNLKLIGANTLIELFDTIFRDLKRSSTLDRVTLMLFDPDYELRRVLSILDMDMASLPQLLLLQDAAHLPPEQLNLRKPQLCMYSEERHALLFPSNAIKPASVAIMPLYRQKQMIGFLNFGSADPVRFAENDATDFIEEQAAIIAVCLENVINHERLKHIGLTDPLTGINNRRYIESRLLEEIRRAQRHNHPLSCMYIDIDYFKQVNDSLGHQYGDEVLCEVAARIKSELRLSDAIGRFGGEEFIVLLVDTDAVGARQVAERIRTCIDGHIFRLSNGNPCQITVSIGVATMPTSSASLPAGVVAQDFVGKADMALYQAKNGGRNRVVSFV